MSRYIDYTNEISSVDLYDGLLGYGLFANKIPQFLESEAFMNYTKALVLPFNISPKEKDYIRYSNIRNINVPRALAIPEPFAYANLCYNLSQNWQYIKDFFDAKTLNQQFKVSRIHLRKLYRQSSLFEMNYKNFYMDGEPEEDIVIKSKYVAIADISNCFPSIYSHSIAWALVGKMHAKTNKNPSNWFNKIDFYTRNVKFGETNGLLIGPHASNLISEIILVAVDNEMIDKGFKFVRNIDDYSCYIESYEKAESFFLCLTEELKKYELSLNTKKSKIISLPKANVKNWVTKLNHFNFTNTYVNNGKEGIRIKELKGFLDFVIELMLEENSDSSVLNYAIQILSNKYLGNYAKDYFIKQIHHLVLLYPYLISVLDKYVFDQHDIDKEKIKNIAVDIYYNGIKSRIFEAPSYALFWALKYDFDIGIASIKIDSTTSLDCIFMMIAFRYEKKHYRPIYLKEYKDLARALKRSDFDQYWLFIYEVLPWTDLVGEYRVLKKTGCTFIKAGF